MRPARLLFAAFAFALASPAAAAPTQLGVLTGLNFSTLKISGHSHIEGRTTGAIGGVADITINPNLGIRIEPTFMSGGAKATQRNAVYATVDGVVFNLDYLDIPVLARYNLADTPTHGILLGGFGFKFATRREMDLTRAGHEETVDFNDIFKGYDVTLDLGAGVAFPVGNQSMTIDGRGSLGLVNINSGGEVAFDGGTLDVPATSTKTLAFRLYATYLFPWKQ